MIIQNNGASALKVCLVLYWSGGLLSTTMSSTFNSQILMEKLAELNSSQQSIETLSHWCIFHMNKAKNVVEMWDRQFHSSPHEQRLAFLYLANDILQNSRRKGSEFVGEFWKVLPNALRDVIGNGDEFGRNAALRLINIWEERKVFGSRGQLLKEELVGRNLETSNRNRNPPGFKLGNSAGNGLDKVISAYQVVYGGQVDEDTVLSKCRNAIICIEKVGKEIDGDIRSEQLNGSDTVEEIKGQHAILLGCIQQLTVMESCRANLVSHLRETLREQEFRLSHVRQQLQAAQSQSEKAGNLCTRQFQNNSVQLLAEQNMKKTHTSKVPQSFMAGSGGQTAPVMYTRQVPNAVKPETLEEDFKSGAAAVAAQLTASTSSGQMPTYILSSLATEGVIVSATKESSNDYPPEKKPKLENDHSVYIPSQNPQPPVPPFPHPDSLKPTVSITSKEIIPEEQPPLPTSPPPVPPLPPMHPYPVPLFMHNAGSVPSVPYGYATTQQQPQPLRYPTFGTQFTGISPFPAPPANSYQNYQTEGGFYGQQPSFSNAPISRQL